MEMSYDTYTNAIQNIRSTSTLDQNPPIKPRERRSATLTPLHLSLEPPLHPANPSSHCYPGTHTSSFEAEDTSVRGNKSCFNKSFIQKLKYRTPATSHPDPSTPEPGAPTTPRKPQLPLLPRHSHIII
ncbi:hypothetical protein JZ751_004449 [Albula glossodonta]|uniref:Uncharacterized protein n=1 Tax=Albula glossodonta TaxID=121402 RepID=A0A8T2MYL8_9TELE|nr:hypothetical protein JZ751_004449 [Albula glossodonta]